MEKVSADNVKVLNNPIISHNLAIIRNKLTDTQNFKHALKIISYALIFEASKDIPVKKNWSRNPFN